MTKSSKRMSLTEAISMIKDGDMLTFSGFTIWRRPMAAVYEIVRQGKKNLHLMEVNSGTHSEVLIGAGCVKIWESCWIGHELFGKLGGNFSRKVKAGEIIANDYSHVHMVLRLMAGAMGVPYLPTAASMGTDILNPELDSLAVHGLRNGENPKIPAAKFEVVKDNFYDMGELVHIPAAKPDVCIMLAQQVGEEGTVRINGQKYTDEEAAKAADKIIVIAEEVVPEEYIRREPDRNLIPPYLVDAIVELPMAGHPTGCYGKYEVDGDFIRDFYSKTRTQEGFDAWAQEWVFGVKDHYEYLEKLGVRRLENLRANSALNYSSKVKRGAR